MRFNMACIADGVAIRDGRLSIRDVYDAVIVPGLPFEWTAAVAAMVEFGPEDTEGPIPFTVTLTLPDGGLGWKETTDKLILYKRGWMVRGSLPVFMGLPKIGLQEAGDYELKIEAGGDSWTLPLHVFTAAQMAATRP
ncbi:MAG: hypothetical protein M5U18_01235 [Dehalococcoidia bacterium]|nr:hypothetical protein [Dehalococcoidia bacterium]